MPRSRGLIAGVISLAAIAGAAVVATTAFAKEAPAGPPTVVEMFQSQGCLSCPPANENILTLVDRPDLLVLSFGVTYWDRLGWKDTFASKENTQRQYDYANGGLHRRNVATPQVVINGHVDIVGNRREDLLRAVDGSRLPASAPAISRIGDRITVAAASAATGVADVWLVRYDPRTAQVPIQSMQYLREKMHVTAQINGKPVDTVVRTVVPVGDQLSRTVEVRLAVNAGAAFVNKWIADGKAPAA
jgi:hypothetical protein